MFIFELKHRAQERKKGRRNMGGEGRTYRLKYQPKETRHFDQVIKYNLEFLNKA